MPLFFDRGKFRRVSDIVRSPIDPEEVSAKKISLFRKKGRVGALTDLVATKPKNKPSAPPKQKKLARSIIVAVIAFLVIGGGFIYYSLYNFRKNVVQSLESELNRFNTQVFDLRPFESSPNKETFKTGADLNPKNPIQVLGTEIWPLLKDSVGAYKDFQELASQALILLEKSETLITNLPDLLFHQGGGEIISKLKEISGILNNVSNKNAKLAGVASRLKDFSPGNFDFYLPLQTDLGKYQNFLNSTINWLNSSSSRHIFVMLLNPSEIRPGGGFLGSYADISLRGANLESIDVHDINELDRSITSKTVPPKPIQAITTNWKTADANWFFDFPSSAGKILQFAEGSDLYNKNGIAFDGTLAMSSRVIEDLLSIVGPIEIKEDNITITSDNFLFEIQKQVQAGQKTKAPNPKKILQDLTPLVVEKLASLDSAQKQKLFNLVGNWFSNKDLMVYFRDPELQKFFSGLDLSGQVYELPQGFIGDYLAVVNANLGGGKTDIFIDQKITLVSQINDDGIVANHLVIERTHRGNESKDWWYKTTNQNYLQIFTPPNPQLENFSGGVKKTIKPPTDYKKGNYITDPLVSQIESTRKDFLNYPAVESFEEFGKSVLATWTKTEIGKKSKIVFDYTHRLPVPLAEGKTYQFIFERQAGLSGVYKFEISAPISFVWEENNLPIFEYQSSDPPGRLIINLTLKKASQ